MVKMINRLPDFMIIGPTRCGTSSLYKNLLRHPRIDGPKKDKFAFFYANYEKGIDWYKAQFPDVNSDVLLCEANALYIFHSECPRHIYRWLPEIKLIVMLRNPVTRSWSHFYCNRNRENPEWQNLMRGDHPVLEQGIYADLLLPWLKYFDRKQLLIIKSEDFFENSGQIVSDCFKFLNLPDMKFESYKYYDPRKEKPNQNLGEHPKIPSEIEKWLGEFFVPHNRQLYQLLGKDFGWR